ncbi:FAS1-like dehydratase domain-containing protein [Tersicoccus solisilvae]|uniref:FAS1-like dehydratase domain-containing protein n=1 Tax=Tersicoccus solisilvae TaxID=1882339 RepID=UPI0016692D2C|nr:MaoC family dehydratase N-terminal domain-containing protein [Tersicoccus solisilvae]
MPVNQDLQGKVYPATPPYAVGREKIGEFARAVKATHPAHFELEAAQDLGYRDVVAPPTFAIIVSQRAEAQLVGDEEAGIDFSRVVHAEQRFTHHQPIQAGDELTAELHVDTLRSTAAGAMITTRAEIATVEGERVATAVSTLIVRGDDA